MQKNVDEQHAPKNLEAAIAQMECAAVKPKNELELWQTLREGGFQNNTIATLLPLLSKQLGLKH